MASVSSNHSLDLYLPKSLGPCLTPDLTQKNIDQKVLERLCIWVLVGFSVGCMPWLKMSKSPGKKALGTNHSSKTSTFSFGKKGQENMAFSQKIIL